MSELPTINGNRSSASRGFILAMVVVFGAVFLIIGVGMASYLLVMQHAEQTRVQTEQAFDIAEAGLNYYAWHLAHFPSDLQDGTGHGGPYVHQYQDPEGGTAGTYSLSINGNLQCGLPSAVDITSTGATAQNPNRTVSVFGRYARESVASYAYIFNTAVKASPSSTFLGRVHSNGGIRMDGNNLSTVESSVATWTCTSAYGCSPDTTEPGVFGAGTNPGLWQFPVPQIDFGSISVNLSALKTAGQTGGGLYFPPAAGAQNQRGYHLVFQPNGTVNVSVVTETTPIWNYSTAYGWAQEYTIIAAETAPVNYTIPSGCSVIFVEDRAWVEGTIKGKVTVAAADLTGSGYVPDIILPNNITYASYDGTNGFTAISAGNVLIPLNSPDTMTLHGIFIAQNGYYGRNYYENSGDYYSVPPAYYSDVLRTSLTTVGSFVSNQRAGITWGNPVVSGYESSNASYDGFLAASPPPFTPYTSTQYHFVLWRQ